ncbi:MAG: HDOD domain-containing protein [Pseudomonadota bacterium]
MGTAQRCSVSDLVNETNVFISLPEICFKLRRVLVEPLHTRKDVASIIHLDTALSARLLRIVNSAYFGLPVRISNISQALGIIGEQELNNLVFVTAIVKSFSSTSGSFDIKQFWRNSIFVAIIARNFAKRANLSGKEEYFLAGLLLNIGKLVLYAKEPELRATVEEEIANSGRADFEVEKDLLGYDHAEVGAELASNWNFPETLIESIAKHHQPDGLSRSTAQEIMYCASWLGELAQKHGSIENIEDVTFVSDFTQTLSLRISAEELLQIIQYSHEEHLLVYEMFCGNS